MAVQLAEEWWMGVMVAGVAAVLLTLNLREVATEGPGRITLLSSGAAFFSVLLGWALTVRPSEADR